MEVRLWECEWLRGGGRLPVFRDIPRPRPLLSFPGNSGVVLPRAELVPLPPSLVEASIGAGSEASAAALIASCPTQKSQKTQPSTVPALAQLTTATGEALSSLIPTKQQTKMTTEQICCTITVESATRGQKSYSCKRGFRCKWERKVGGSV